MSSDTHITAAITIDETYHFSVDVGDQTSIAYAQGGGSVRIHIPYDGLLLDPQGTQQSAHDLGTLCIRSRQLPETEQRIPITLPPDSLAERMKQGMQYVWEGAYQLNAPTDTLIAIDGTVFDGADITPTDGVTDLADLQQLLFGQTDVFVSDLRLQLSLWVPNLFEQLHLRSQADELRAMLFDQESATQILLSEVADTEQLARSLVALANSAGGRILIGVKSSGEVIGVPDSLRAERLERSLLKAALHCTPPVPFFAPDFYTTGEGKTILRLVVPASTKKPHAVGSHVYRRNGGLTQVDLEATPARVDYVSQPTGDLQDILASGNSRDVVILDAQGMAIDQLELGPYICGLLNADIPSGLLIIRNLRTDGFSSGGLRLWRDRRSLVQQFEARLRDEVSRMTPLSTTLHPEFASASEERVVVVRIARHLAPTALYNDKGYLWADGALREIGIHEIFGRYLKRMGTRDVHQPTGSRVHLEYAEIGWPVQPPSPLKVNPAIVLPELTAYAYAVQRRSMAWRPQLFELQPGTNGLQCQLTTRLRHAFTHTANEDDVGRVLRGQLCVRFDDVLASGTEITQQEGTNHSLFQGLPIRKRTYLVLDLTIRAYELFRRRRLTTLLHFRIPDIALGSERRERVADLRQACADLGFWIYQVYPPEVPDETLPYVFLRGIRSTKYHDVHLLAGVRYEPNQLTRELRYEQRIDSKHVLTGVLDVRIVLSGMADDAAPENGMSERLDQLQLELRQLLNQRLDYLRSE